MYQLIDFIDNNPHIREEVKFNLIKNEVIQRNFDAHFDAVQCVLTSSAGLSDIQRILEDATCLECISSQLPEYSRVIKLVLNSPVFDLTNTRGGTANRIEILKSSFLIPAISGSYPVFECFFRSTLFFSNRNWAVFQDPSNIFWKNVKTYEMEALLVMNSSLLPMDKFALLQSSTALLNIRNNQATVCWLLLQNDEGVNIEVFESLFFSLPQASRKYLEWHRAKEQLEKSLSEAKWIMPVILAGYVLMAYINLLIVSLWCRLEMMLDSPLPWTPMMSWSSYQSLLYYTSVVGTIAIFSTFVFSWTLLRRSVYDTRKRLSILEASQKENIKVISSLINYFSFNKELIEGLKAYLHSKGDPCFSPGSIHLIELLPFLSWDPEDKARYLRENNRSSELDKINDKLPALPPEVVDKIARYYFFSPPARTSHTSTEATSEIYTP